MDSCGQQCLMTRAERAGATADTSVTTSVNHPEANEHQYAITLLVTALVVSATLCKELRVSPWLCRVPTWLR